MQDLIYRLEEQLYSGQVHVRMLMIHSLARKRDRVMLSVANVRLIIFSLRRFQSLI